MRLSFNFFKKPHLGFTLVELLVVVAITGILASASYFGISDVRKGIRDNKRRADLNEVARALELFKADYGQYPSNLYYSADYQYGVPDRGDNRPFMEFLAEGGDILFYYPGGGETRAVSGGYLDADKRDPINHVDSFYNGHMYLYWGAQWGSMILSAVEWLEDWADESDLFPMYCPPPNTGGDYCGDSTWSLADNWNACCNSGCFNAYCDFTYPDDLQILSYYPQNGWSSLCYGSGTTRSVALLMTNLEKPSKPEERINNVFAFCPTADPSHPEHDLFVRLKKLFPRGKDCYNGNDPDWSEGDPGDWNCDDETTEASWWALAEHNYFIPLTGEFNLR